MKYTMTYLIFYYISEILSGDGGNEKEYMWGREMVMIVIMRLSFRILTCSEFSGLCWICHIPFQHCLVPGYNPNPFSSREPWLRTVYGSLHSRLRTKVAQYKNLSGNSASFFLKYCGDSQNQEFPPPLSQLIYHSSLRPIYASSPSPQIPILLCIEISLVYSVF